MGYEISSLPAKADHIEGRIALGQDGIAEGRQEGC